MAVGAMGAVNAASAISGIVGNVGGAGGASASSGQGGAGIGFNLLGAPGDPFGVGMNLIKGRLDRNDRRRQIKLQEDVFAMEQEKWSEEKKQLNALRNRKTKIANIMMGFGG